MKDWEILSERELVALEQSSGDDCDMASVKCVVRELRRLRELRDNFCRWRRGTCSRENIKSGSCDGETNHASDCPVLVLWQDVIAAHNKLDPKLERGE